MMRRRHKKSRKGCLECKKRHIKCDETRPRCINCATVDRECQYSTPTAPSGDTPGRSPSASGSVGTSPQPPGGPGPSGPYSAAGGPGFSTNPVSAPFPAPGPAPVLLLPAHDLGDYYQHHQHQPLNSKVDLVHMQLFHHYLISHTDIYPFVMGDLHNIIVKMALFGSEHERPFLMHSLLALSARHLSSVSSGDQGRYYHDLAIQLQTEALTLFNSFDVDYFAQSMERRLPAFMFSAIIGFHALCDMLSYRDDDFGVALKRFTEYLRLHRGIISVMDGYWEDLKRTELGIVFDMAVPVEFLEGIMTNVYEEGSGAEEEGKVCGDILGRLEGARDAGILTQEEFAAASRAVRALQWVFETAPEHNRQMHVLCSWAVLVPQPLVGMIEVGRGEALVILGYFFLALHYCRNAWLIGDSGEFLLKGLASHLGEEWKPWLESPMRILMDSLEANEMERQRRATSVNSQFTSSSLSPDVSMSVGSTPQYYPDNNNNR